MSNENQSGSTATNMFATVVGSLMALAAILLIIPITPMLLFARDSRDMVGGIAGAVLVVFMLLAGVVLVLREKAPPSVMRAFYFGIGVVSLLSGIGVFAWGIYSIGTGANIEKRALTMPLVFVAFGVEWIRRGFSVSRNCEQDSRETMVT